MEKFSSIRYMFLYAYYKIISILEWRVWTNIHLVKKRLKARGRDFAERELAELCYYFMKGKWNVLLIEWR